MAAGLLRITLYVAIIALGPVLAYLLGHAEGGALYEIGRIFGLLGFMILVLQFFLAARFKWIERPFGFDILIRFHQHAAALALALLLLHPILLAAGGAGWKLLFSLELPWYVLAGKAALLLLVVTVLVSKLQGKLKLAFERWRLLHDLLAPLLIILAFIHGLLTGNDMQLLSLRSLWIASLAGALGVFAWHRFIRQQLLSRRPYRVTEVRPEAERVWTVTLEPPEGEPIPDFNPGQFHFLTFHRNRGLPEEEHHWTISSSPSESRTISSTIKAVGDFTETIGQTRPGDTATVHGPFGRFSYALHPDEKDLVFLAGGIGITPLMSMLRHMRDQEDDRSVLLLYANRREEDIIFRGELAEIEAGGYPQLRVVHVLSRPDQGWNGQTGHVDGDLVLSYCGEKTAGKTFYLCGPPGMVQGLLKALPAMGVPDERIRLEIFSFLNN